MTVVRTDTRATRDNAERLRFQPTGGISETNVQKAIEQVSTRPPSLTPTSVTNALSPFAPTNDDVLLEVDSSAGAVTINLQDASIRTLPLVIKDIAGAASTHNITINPNGANTIDGAADYVINADYGAVNLFPRSGTGYSVVP
jgi:hypothetical protein